MLAARFHQPHVERAAEAIAKQIERGYRQKYCDNRQQEIPRRLIDVLTRVRDHLTPGRLISADTESDKGQDRFDYNSNRHFETDQRDQKR